MDRPGRRRSSAGPARGECCSNEDCRLAHRRGRVKKIAVIGPNTATARIMGGGSAHVNAHYAVSPLEGIRAFAGDR